MSRRLRHAARARELLGRAESLCADLPSTLRRWEQLDHSVTGYYERLGTSDRAFDEVRHAESRRVDQAIRKVSADFPAWIALDVDDVTAVGRAGFGSLSELLASHPNGFVREVATASIVELRRSSRIRTLVLRCLDPVREVRDIAADEIARVLTATPTDLLRQDYEILGCRRAERLVPDLAAEAAIVAGSDPYVVRRDVIRPRSK